MRSPLFLCAILSLAACDAPPIEWGDPVGAAAPAGSRLVVDSAGHARFVADSTGTATLGVAGACPTSIRSVRGTTLVRAVWWGLRRDSTAVLYMASSADWGKSWDAPVVVDTADVYMRGCQRPAPAVAALGDDVHIAYSMAASEGTGVFFAHYLSSMVHAPVAVIYGDRLVSTAIAAEGNRVAVAYENPNGTRHRVEVAISSTQGHIFESHMIASRDIDDATEPAVALSGQHIAVAWTSPRPTDSSSTRVIRVGRIR